MANENLPTRWDEELAKHAQKIAQQERPAVGRLAFRGGVMTYQGQPVPGNKLNCIIVGSAKEHALYENVLQNRPFDPNKPENPTCYALSLTGEDMVPHAQAKQKMAPNCADCKYNAWGSHPGGGKGKACKESRRLIILPQSAVFIMKDGQATLAPEGSIKKAEAAVASIPSTSLKNWANYTAQCATEFRRPPWAMLTEIAIYPHARTVFEVKFTALTTIPESFLGELLQRTQTAEAIIMTPYSQDSNAPPQQPMKNRKY